MTRTEAISLLAQQDLAELSLQDRESRLLDWWSMDEGDAGYAELPSELKQAMRDSDSPVDAGLELFDPLLLIALEERYVGVLNDYLNRRLTALGFGELLDGPVEPMAACPCCGFHSLRERGHYEICGVCFWEDDGDSPPDHVSGPNRMTLREAQSNFKRIGAMNERALHHVLADGRERYALVSLRCNTS
jgi:hypothetical protein